MRDLFQHLAMITLLLLPPVAQAQTNSTKKIGTQSPTSIDPCKPIGRTEDGKLVYGMNCSNVAPRATPEATETKQKPEITRRGIFGMSYGER